MNVLFEDEGQLKAGTVLVDQETSLHVEAASGRRQKIKAGNVLLRFEAPGPADALAEAQRLAADLDANFLWEVSGDDEFGFADLAREYYGRTPTAAQAGAVALALSASPMHFQRRGRGHYRRAAPEALRAALASVERKRREAQASEEWIASLAAGRLPEALAAKLPMLLYKPDRNSLEWKALARACEARKTGPVELIAACGAIPSTHEFHFNRFLADSFPQGTAFPHCPPLPPVRDLPLAGVRAFSIDDASTTEIDDAFSVVDLGDGRARIGIHIACPALALARGSPHDAVARARLSTVYMPGRKLTMLPEAWIDAFTLRAGTAPPALTLYVDVDAGGAVERTSTAVERVPVAANLHLAGIGDAFVRATPSPSDPAWTAELRILRGLAERRFDERGRKDVERIDFSFAVDWDRVGANGEPGVVAIVPRPRGSPLDRLVSELMILVNGTWGRMLADARVPGLYRVQSGGKVKMSTGPGEHQGLGLAHYLWASSPLRRYADLVNQRQILALVAGERPPYAANDAELFAVLADFEATYSQYAELQDRMEHYWCLRWLLQERVDETTAIVVRDNLVRFERLPLFERLAGMPPVAPETRVRVGIVRVDLLAATLQCRYAGEA
jgi:exoribonuclease-2